MEMQQRSGPPQASLIQRNGQIVRVRTQNGGPVDPRMPQYAQS